MVFKKNVLDRLLKRYEEVNRQFYETFDLEPHLKALSAFFLMESGDVKLELTRVFFDRLDSGNPRSLVLDLNQIVERVIEDSAERDIFKKSKIRVEFRRTRTTLGPSARRGAKTGGMIH